MTAPLFPAFRAFRARLAALGSRTARDFRQATLAQLARHLADLIPVQLLSSAEAGRNSRDRIYSLRLTCECFLWQMLTRQTSCREVVRQVQAQFRLLGWGAVEEGSSAYIQARQRLPQECLEQVLAATAQAARRKVKGKGVSSLK